MVHLSTAAQLPQLRATSQKKLRTYRTAPQSATPQLAPYRCPKKVAPSLARARLQGSVPAASVSGFATLTLRFAWTLHCDMSDA
jgi:hypothetical protein